MHATRDANWYRKEAERIRNLAEQESNAELRDSYRKLSKAYEALAKVLEVVERASDSPTTSRDRRPPFQQTGFPRPTAAIAAPWAVGGVWPRATECRGTYTENPEQWPPAQAHAAHPEKAASTKTENREIHGRNVTSYQAFGPDYQSHSHWSIQIRAGRAKALTIARLGPRRPARGFHKAGHFLSMLGDWACPRRLSASWMLSGSCGLGSAMENGSRRMAEPEKAGRSVKPLDMAGSQEARTEPIASPPTAP